MAAAGLREKQTGPDFWPWAYEVRPFVSVWGALTLTCLLASTHVQNQLPSNCEMYHRKELYSAGSELSIADMYINQGTKGGVLAGVSVPPCRT